MTEQEKALNLIDKFENFAFEDIKTGDSVFKNAKQCAKICVDEIIEQWEHIDTYLADLGGEINPNLKYWHRVKQIINQL